MENTNLRSYEDYLKERKFNKKWQWWSRMKVACPKCGCELMTPLVVKLNDKQIINCSGCEFEDKI